jgi:hypothetical protein
MADKRLLYLTVPQLQAYSWKAGRLVADGAFETGDEGASEFSRYLGGSPKSLYYLVADVIDEDFFQENIPFVRGKDRRTLLARKIAQRYRDISLALALSLGKEEGLRREERILFSSFTNTQPFQPWLAALRSNEARLVGVYSLALIAPLVAKRLKLTAPRFILVSLQNGGMRQSYVDGGQIRFSRLGRADPADPRAAAEACAAESNRILQFLINLRIVPRETGLLDVVALAPAAHRNAYEVAWGDNARLKLNFIDLESACKTAGLKSAPPEMLGERLFLHVLAGKQPARQFASDALRRFYHLWRARLALLAGGAAVCAFSLLLSGVRLLEVIGINNETTREAQQEASISQEYDLLQANFPKTPLPRAMLKAAVGTASVILRQSVLPDRLFADISQALSAVPQIELDKLDWEVSSNPRVRATAGPAKPAAPAAPVPAPAEPSATPAQGEASRYYEVADISARINAVKASDYRSISAVVEQFVQALRQRPGLEVIGTRTPLDALSEKAVTGDVGEQERNEVPNFTVTVSRRIGA